MPPCLACFLDRTQAAFATFGFDAVLEDRGLTNGVKTVRLRGGLREHLRFLQLVDPAIRRKCSVEGIAVKSNADLRVPTARLRIGSALVLCA